MSHASDASFLRSLILGGADPLASDLPGRLAVLAVQYRAFLDGGMLDLIRRAEVARARADEAADRAFLNGLTDGTGDLLSEDTFPRMEPMFAKYSEGSEMFALLEKAAAAFGEAVTEYAAWVQAGLAIDEARLGRGNEWSDHED